MKNFSKNLTESIAYSEGGITSKQLTNDSNANVTLFCMAAGTKISEHTSLKQGHVYVIEGKGRFILEKDPIEMQPGVLIQMKENSAHSIEAEENTSFILFLA